MHKLKHTPCLSIRFSRTKTTYTTKAGWNVNKLIDRNSALDEILSHEMATHRNVSVYLPQLPLRLVGRS